ncbi:hypothetical protein [Salinicoccus roseus]|uniref:hypothetical protein n=1 Tax=Salinicoccus roseus TaxID=45670 RepID=UPI0035637B97
MEKKKFTELDVEKLNIVDSNGKIKMTLFNQENIPPVILDGQVIMPGHRLDDPISGLMFYNGREEDEEGNPSMTASLTFDEYRQDQVIQMSYIEEKGQTQYGFSVFDRPNRPLSHIVNEHREIEASDMSDEEEETAYRVLYKGNAPRAFMGKSQNGDVSMKLMDSKGKDRIRMVIDEDDEPRMEFLNAHGDVTYKLP